MPLTHNDIFIWTAVRQLLTTYARLAASMEAPEYARFQNAVLEEVRAIVPHGKFHEIWRQAAEGMAAEARQAPASYGLARIGLWPESQQPVAEESV